MNGASMKVLVPNQHKIMNMFKQFTAVTAALTMCVSAQEKDNNPDNLISGVMTTHEGKTISGLFKGANKQAVFYKPTARAVNLIAERRTQVQSLYLFAPKDYKAALAAFEDRKYKEAAEKFSACKERYKAFKVLPNNYSTLSGYYMLESYRKAGDLDKLIQEKGNFDKVQLTRPDFKTQVEVYDLWDAVRTKEWKRLHNICKDWDGKRVPIGIRSQIEYCHGMAYEGMGETSNALNAYAAAMTADFTKSDTIVRQAALNSLRIFRNNPDVKTTMRLWDGDKDKDEGEEVKTSDGFGMLVEANALARLYNKANLGAGVALSAADKKFLDYTPKKVLDKEKEAKEMEDK